MMTSIDWRGTFLIKCSLKSLAHKHCCFIHCNHVRKLVFRKVNDINKRFKCNSAFYNFIIFQLNNVEDIRGSSYRSRKPSIQHCDPLNSYKDISDCDAIVVAKAWISALQTTNPLALLLAIHSQTISSNSGNNGCRPDPHFHFLEFPSSLKFSYCNFHFWTICKSSFLLFT